MASMSRTREPPTLFAVVAADPELRRKKIVVPLRLVPVDQCDRLGGLLLVFATSMAFGDAPGFSFSRAARRRLNRTTSAIVPRPNRERGPNTGALLEDEKRVRADSGESLKRMLNQEDHR